MRIRTVAALIAWALLVPAARLEAAPIFEPNNTAGSATILNSGTLIVSDNLNGNAGRPDTLLGLYNASYTTLLASDNNGSTLGNGFASQLVDVPLNGNGSAYFRITGFADANFIGGHTQAGQYYVRFDLYDSNHNFFKTLPLEFDGVIPGFVDNIWIDPPAIPEPQRVGGTVTVTVQNIVGPGTGDSVDFFWFSGLDPGQSFTAMLSTANFNARLGLFGGPSNTLQTSSEGAHPSVSGIADGLGRALFAVTGAGDTNFLGVHAQAGDYTLVVLPAIVPEPSSIVLLACGGAAAGLTFRRRRKLAG
ncbi:MAG: PEP-CTERM sorting domain-containing protein [Pirellulales bacterium]